MELRSLAVIAITLGNPTLGLGVNPSQAEDIVRRSVTNTNTNWADAPGYDFTERDTVIQNGKRTSKTYQVLMIEGSPYNKLIAVDGQPVAAKEGEDHKLQQEIKRRRSESPSARQKRLEQYQKERRQDHALMSEMVKAFEFTLKGEETVNGRRCFVLQAEPKPGYKPLSRDTQVLRGMRGQMWVDAEEYQWVRVHAEVFRAVSFGLFFARVKPGTEFTLEQQPVQGKLWLPSHFTMNVKARVLLWSKTSAEDEVYSNYHPGGTVEAASPRFRR
jgi:hypothetical protein